MESHHYRDAQNDDDGKDYMAVRERLPLDVDAQEKSLTADDGKDYMAVRELPLEVDAQEKSLTADAATHKGLRLEIHHRDAQDDDDEMDYMAETRRVMGLETHHYCHAQDDSDWMDHIAVHDSDQQERDANEKEKLSVGVAAVVRSGLEIHHETNMDVGKRFQLEEDAQETEKMNESGEDDWDNNRDNDLGVGLDVGLDIGLDVDLEGNLVVELDSVLDQSGSFQTDQHL